MGAISHSIDGGAECCLHCAERGMERALNERPWDQPFRMAVSEPEPLVSTTDDFTVRFVPVENPYLTAEVLQSMRAHIAENARAFDKLAASTAPVINALDGLSRAFQALIEVRSEAEDLARASTDEQLLDYAERHPVREHRETARAEMQARWAARAALPPMLDDFDNLPDAEPAGIVRRP